MSRIETAFDHGKAFISFITCGDPDLETTEKLLPCLEAAGADLIELGIPFSDPSAEGPVIQAASQRALARGVTTDKIFAMVERARDKVKVPLVFMTYANLVFSYGIEDFVRRAKEVGIEGLILPDVPYEEKEEFEEICQKYQLGFISLIAPTSGERIPMIAREAQGFIYCVSSLGVTGVRDSITEDIGAMVSQVRQVSSVPVAVGFGISSPEEAKRMAAAADGVIVGSAIVKIIAEYGRDSLPHVAAYVKAMKKAIS